MVITCLEALQHIALEMEGSVFRRICYPSIFNFTIYTIKEIMNRRVENRIDFVEKNAAFIINFMFLMMLTESVIFTHPTHQIVSPM